MNAVFDTLPISWRLVLAAIANAPVAWSTPAELARSLGWDLDATNDLLADLDVAGWVAPWERPEGVAATLTPLAARGLLVELAPAGRDGTLHWSRPQAPARRVVRSGRSSSWWADAVPDRQPDPALWLDAALSSTPHHRGNERRPVHLLGVSRLGWPGPRSRCAGKPCPVCGSAPLEPTTYCLWCDRSGRDRGRPVRDHWTCSDSDSR